MKKNIYAAIIFMAGMCFMAVPAMSVKVLAAEGQQEEIIEGEDTSVISEIKQIMTAKKEAEVKRDPNTDTETLMSFSSGDYVYVIAETANGWYLINYQNVVGYVEKSALGSVEVETEKLRREMNTTETEGEVVVEESRFVIPEMDETTKWIVVIGFLLGGVVITGLILALMTKLSSLGGGKKKK